MLFDTVESEAQAQTDITTERTTIAATLAAAARGPPPARRPGDVGGPAANPVHHTPSGRVNRPRAAEQSAPPSAAARTAGRKTDGPLYGAAAPGGGGRLHLHPEAGRPPPCAFRNPRASMPPIRYPAPRQKKHALCGVHTHTHTPLHASQGCASYIALDPPVYHVVHDLLHRSTPDY